MSDACRTDDEPRPTAGPGRDVPPAGPVRVAAAAIVRDGRVLAARRSRPAGLAGGWEFPGGKLEPGEDGPAAAARECHEELTVRLAVGARLAVTPAGGQPGRSLELALYAARLADGDEPRPGDSHDALRWLAAAELEDVAWLPADAALLPAVRNLLVSERPKP